MPQLIDLVPEVVANGIVGVGCAHISEIEGALVLSVVLNETRRNDIEIVYNIGERGRDVDIPIGSTVADNETLEVIALCLLVDRNKLIVLMNLPGEVRYVDTSIALTGDVKRVIEEFRETAIEVLNGSKGIL